MIINLHYRKNQLEYLLSVINIERLKVTIKNVTACNVEQIIQLNDFYRLRLKSWKFIFKLLHILTANMHFLKWS